MRSEKQISFLKWRINGKIKVSKQEKALVQEIWYDILNEFNSRLLKLQKEGNIRFELIKQIAKLFEFNKSGILISKMQEYERLFSQEAGFSSQHHPIYGFELDAVSEETSLEEAAEFFSAILEGLEVPEEFINTPSNRKSPKFPPKTQDEFIKSIIEENKLPLPPILPTEELVILSDQHRNENLQTIENEEESVSTIVSEAEDSDTEISEEESDKTDIGNLRQQMLVELNKIRKILATVDVTDSSTSEQSIHLTEEEIPEEKPL
ncbi:MAG: hypothetical protein ACFFBD_07055 [Candidatus Hodarchaeota archaeon]